MGRKRIGLLFDWGSSWTGGYYYLLNIIRVFCKLPESDQPHLVLFTVDGLPPKLEDVQYNHLSILPIRKRATLVKRVLRKIGVLNKITPMYPSDLVGCVYPCYLTADAVYGSLEKIRRVYWIPDFQHKYLTHFFSDEELRMRDDQFESISKCADKLVVSSETAKIDFLKFYPNNKNELHIVRFATILPNFNNLSIEKLKEQYKIERPYFMAPNQFWIHKNHRVVLEAILILKAKGIDFLVVFTGNESDYRNPGYTQTLKEFVTSNGIESNVKFLGFIDRCEQLQLMNHAIAIIQPSLFEGWSTVIEDAKAMNQSIIASDLSVHREQCSTNAHYFNPDSPHDLALIIERFIKEKITRPEFNYEESVANFSQQLLATL